jgi:uncharacterized protein with GYD domain
MATYIMLSTLSPDGANTLIENPERLLQVNREVESMGARVVGQWAVLGPYDFITVLETDEDAVISRIAVQLGSRGTIKTMTLTAFPVEEFITSLRKD